jgi:hypothetical protein
MDNLPDNWGDFYHRCSECGERWHESEGHECSGEKPEPDPPERETDEDDLWFAERAEKSAFGGAW